MGLATPRSGGVRAVARHPFAAVQPPARPTGGSRERTPRTRRCAGGRPASRVPHPRGRRVPLVGDGVPVAAHDLSPGFPTEINRTKVSHVQSRVERERNPRLHQHFMCQLDITLITVCGSSHREAAFERVRQERRRPRPEPVPRRPRAESRPSSPWCCRRAGSKMMPASIATPIATAAIVVYLRREPPSGTPASFSS